MYVMLWRPKAAFLMKALLSALVTNHKLCLGQQPQFSWDLWIWSTNTRIQSLRKPPIETQNFRSKFSSVQFNSVAQSCPTLFDPMNCSMPGLPVHHQLPELTQTHVHLVGDAIQASHPLSSPSPPAPNPSQHQSLFQWVNSSHEVAKILEFQL